MKDIIPNRNKFEANQLNTDKTALYVTQRVPVLPFPRCNRLHPRRRFPAFAVKRPRRTARPLIHRRHPPECLLRSDYWVKRIYARLRGAMGQTAVIDKRRAGSILSGHGYRVQPRSRFL